MHNCSRSFFFLLYFLRFLFFYLEKLPFFSMMLVFFFLIFFLSLDFRLVIFHSGRHKHLFSTTFDLYKKAKATFIHSPVDRQPVHTLLMKHKQFFEFIYLFYFFPTIIVTYKFQRILWLFLTNSFIIFGPTLISSEAQVCLHFFLNK